MFARHYKLSAPVCALTSDVLSLSCFFYSALVLNNSHTSLSDVWSLSWVGGQKKKSSPPVFDFLRRILLRIVSLLARCSVWQVQPDEIPVSLVTLFPRPTPESLWIVRTQSRYEFVTSCHFILGCRQSFLTKRHSDCTLRSARFFFLFLSLYLFSPKKKT